MNKEDANSCPCKRKNCERHGDCAACREHHKNVQRKYLPACDRLSEKREKRRLQEK